MMLKLLCRWKKFYIQKRPSMFFNPCNLLAAIGGTSMICLNPFSLPEFVSLLARPHSYLGSHEVGDTSTMVCYFSHINAWFSS